MDNPPGLQRVVQQDLADPRKVLTTSLRETIRNSLGFTIQTINGCCLNY